MKSACWVPFRQASFDALTPPSNVPAAVSSDYHHSLMPLHLVSGTYLSPPFSPSFRGSARLDSSLYSRAVVSRILWKFSGGVLRACESSLSQAASVHQPPRRCAGTVRVLRDIPGQENPHPSRFGLGNHADLLRQAELQGTGGELEATRDDPQCP